MSAVFKLGVVLLISAFGMWLYEHEFENTLPISPNLDTWAAMAGGILLAIFGLVYLYSSMFNVSKKWSKSGRCVRCGVKVKKNEMYCDFHKNEVANEFLTGNREEPDLL
mgnify:CR=1 FL=1